jgi:hypothetical protein
MTEEKSDQKPLVTVKVGSVEGACWQNEFKKNGKIRFFKTFSFKRSRYDPQTKQWQSFNAFTLATLGSLLLAIILIAVKELLGRKDSEEESLEDDIPV